MNNDPHDNRELNIGDRVRESMLIDVLTRDFDAVFLCHTANGHVQSIRFDESNVRVYGSADGLKTVDDMLMNVQPMIHPDDLPMLERVLHDPVSELANGLVRYYDYRSKRDGSYRYWRLKLIKADDAANEVIFGFTDVDDSVRDEKSSRDTLSKRLAEQEEYISAQSKRYDIIQKDIVEGMATLVESRDLKTGQHVEHTRAYVSIILDRLYADNVFPDIITPQYIEDVCLASVMHDIGKIFISDVLLNKPGKLSPDEFEIIKTHTVLGAEIVDRVFVDRLNPEILCAIRDIVLGHHEKWNGSGYPLHIAGDDIPLSARIMAVADVFDALISKRAYKDSFTLDNAFDILIKDSGTHFDKRLVDAFIAERPRIEAYLRQQEQSSEEAGMSLFKEFGDFERKLQQESIVRSLTEDYELVLYAEPDLDRISVIRQSDVSAIHVRYAKENNLSFSRFASLSLPYIYEDDRAQYAAEIARDQIRTRFGDNSVRFFTFRREASSGFRWYQMKLYRLGKTEDQHFDVLIGINDVHEFELAKQAEKQALADAKLRAEQANDAKSNFVYRISHDIRTPFSDIVGLTDMAMKQVGNQAALTALLEKIKQSEDELLDAMNRIIRIDSFGNEEASDVTDAAEEDHDQTGSSEEVISLKGRRILLVEDNDLNREIAISILDEFGAEVDEASDGTDAVMLVRSHPAFYYDAVLMDLQMTTMGGIEATSIIRALPDKDVARVPIIAMTANAFERDKIAVKEAGMDAYLTKPIDVPTLLQTLNRFM